MESYSKSYREAARALVERIPPRLKNKGDVRSLPILLLYRHALELIIKEIVMFGGVPKETVLGRQHNLQKHMVDLRKTADSVGVELRAETEAFILRAHQDDPKGDLVRYPMAMDGSWQMLKNAKRFHLETYVLEIERTLNALQRLLEDIQARVYLGH